jgi:hypothetical protein
LEEFILQIDQKKFSSTNGPWNKLRLNDPWSVGYVTTLIELKEFKTKEEWEEFYYKSGSDRKEKISHLAEDLKVVLENEQLVLTNKATVDNLGSDIKTINSQYGRTKEDFQKKANLLLEYMRQHDIEISLDECAECVRYRVICETWNGVIIRERNTISTLKNLYTLTEFRKATSEKDYDYAVDYEAFKTGNLVYAIQIKPKSYLWNAPYIQSARNANKRKQTKYSEEHKVPVYR